MSESIWSINYNRREVALYAWRWQVGPITWTRCWIVAPSSPRALFSEARKMERGRGRGREWEWDGGVTYYWERERRRSDRNMKKDWNKQKQKILKYLILDDCRRPSQIFQINRKISSQVRFCVNVLSRNFRIQTFWPIILRRASVFCTHIGWKIGVLFQEIHISYFVAFSWFWENSEIDYFSLTKILY